MKKRYAIVLGARPNFVKVAPFMREAKNHSNFEFELIHTGQHFDQNMSQIFFNEMNIPRPTIHLPTPTGFHTERIGKMFRSLQEVFHAQSFDGAIVFGDVNSTLAGALAATKSNRFLVHIEAGLRSHDRRMPEEINRVIVDHLSDLLFASEPAGQNNLALEGIPQERVHLAGNIMIESLEIFKEKIQASKILTYLETAPKKYCVATIHRQENIDSIESMKVILEVIQEIHKKIPIIFPLHPASRQRIENFKLDKLLQGFKVIQPLGYFDFIKLVGDSCGVVTDSGGIQEETSHLGIPCATLRENTERPITIEKGSNQLFKSTHDSISKILQHLSRRDFIQGSIPFWDDGVSKRIFNELERVC